MRTRLSKLTSCLITGIMLSAFIGSSITFAKDKGQGAQLNTNSENKIPIKPKERVSVHDPSIVKAGNEYYVFGSHIEAAKSPDLQNWTKFTNSYTTPGNKLFGDLSTNLAGSFAWAGENDCNCKGGYAVWAPYVFWNKNYVNTNGKKGAYMMYYCTSSTYKRSCIGYAVSQNIEGPYTYVNTIVYSGFTSEYAYDTGSSIDTKYTNTNIKTLIGNGTLTGTSSNWFTSSGDFNTSYCPNAIDPDLFYDNNGTLWMTYGSWSGGIYMLKINKDTGNAIYPGKDGTATGGNPTDRYFGTKIAGGYTQSGEGSCVVYDNKTGYYYLYMSYAVLTSNGGYNMRLFRSKKPEGPYVDAVGNKATLPGNVDNAYCGIKLMGNYKFACQSVGYRSPGGNTSFIDSNGQMYLVYHTRFDSGTEYHEVRVHQMFINEDGWPVVAPYEYSGDHICKNGYSNDEVVGSYQFINHGNSNSSEMLDTLNIKLNKDHSITGDVTGSWSMKNHSYFMSININNVTYKGVFFKQQDESGYISKVMTFSAVGTNNQCIWGSKLQ
jgi:arabinan endo-1,5-alpha-L-arabinosidase